MGLNVIQGAKIAGATTIIAIDMLDSKLEMAKEFGATHMVNAAEGDPVARSRSSRRAAAPTSSFEVIGLGATMEQAINTTRTGGEVILVGVPRMDVFLNLNAAFTFLYLAKTIKGCWYGSSNVYQDVPKLLELWRSGDLKLKELISQGDRQRGTSTRPSTT